MDVYDVPFSQNVLPALRPIFSMKEIVFGFGETFTSVSLSYVATMRFTVLFLIFFCFLVSSL